MPELWVTAFGRRLSYARFDRELPEFPGRVRICPRLFAANHSAAYRSALNTREHFRTAFGRPDPIRQSINHNQQCTARMFREVFSISANGVRRSPTNTGSSYIQNHTLPAFSF